MGLASGLPYEHPCADALEQVLEWVLTTTKRHDLDYLSNALATVQDRIDERYAELLPREEAS